MMLTTWDLIKRLKGKRVLDIGGAGYEEEISCSAKFTANAWKGINRTILDINPKADIVMDLNQLPLPPLTEKYDIAVAFDVLEHIKHPAIILEWIPTNELWLNLPCATSFLTQFGERSYQYKIPGFQHLYSYNILTASNLVKNCGWDIQEKFYTAGFSKTKWYGKLFYCFISYFPCLQYLMSTGIFLRCTRSKILSHGDGVVSI